MAKATWRMPEDFLMKVSRLADKTDEILPKVLEAGAEVVEDKVRSNLQAVIGSGTKYESRSTGELLRSLGTSPALQDRNGDFDMICPSNFSNEKYGSYGANALLTFPFVVT